MSCQASFVSGEASEHGVVTGIRLLLPFQCCFPGLPPARPALLLMFFLEYYSMLSGGAIGALTIGLVASNSWEKGLPRFGSSGPSFEYSPTSTAVVRG